MAVEYCTTVQNPLHCLSACLMPMNKPDLVGVLQERRVVQAGIHIRADHYRVLPHSALSRPQTVWAGDESWSRTQALGVSVSFPDRTVQARAKEEALVWYTRARAIARTR